MNENDNPITSTFRSIIGFLITPFALLVLGFSNVLSSITGWDHGYSYAVAFLFPFLMVIIYYVVKATRRIFTRGDQNG